MPQPPVFCAGSLSLCSWSDQKRVTRDKRGSEEERLETIEGLCRCTIVVLLSLKVPALPLLRCWWMRLRLCQQPEIRVNRLHAVSWLERRKGGAVALFCLQLYFCQYEWTCNLQNTMFSVIQITSGFAAGSWGAYLNHPDCSLASEGAAQKWNMIVSLRNHLMYSYNMTKCFVYSLFLSV